MSRMSKNKIMKRHAEHVRKDTFRRTVTNEAELRERLNLPPSLESPALRRSQGRQGWTRAATGPTAIARSTLTRYGRFKVRGRNLTFEARKRNLGRHHHEESRWYRWTWLHRFASRLSRMVRRKPRQHRYLVLVRDRDRFDAMRGIQDNMRRFERYYKLVVALCVFVPLWTLGALVFVYAEKDAQRSLTYFESFYFCFVTLMTVGYGHTVPRSNVGKAFFVVWSLVAVPTITVLINALSDTVVADFNRVTNVLLPERGFLGRFSHANPNHWITRLSQSRQRRRRARAGFQSHEPKHETLEANTLNQSNRHQAGIETDARIRREERTESGEPDKTQRQETEGQLARQLALAIRSVAQDVGGDPKKRYAYGEWAHFKNLISFSAKGDGDDAEGHDGGPDYYNYITDWDWIGEDSPMLADSPEPKWVLDRLCESLDRYTRGRSRGRGRKQPPL
ncbi:hypothetical protein F5Y17DRAFT_129967 [Xylariaceae sp. FL0594]|nr:hypothetical protein F5Y17DRAFT_129967 [Xylariaceae sp. FL0594]